jgi:hypothetical protein
MSSIKYRQNQSDFESNIRLEQLTGETFKGAPLSNNEVDTNFANLNIGKVENDGSIPMSGNLTTPGIDASLADEGFRLYNQNGDLILTAGYNNTVDVVFEGNIDVGDQGSLNMNLGGGDMTVDNIFLNGRLIDQALSEKFNVSNVGDVLRAVPIDSPTLTVDGNVSSGETDIVVDSVANVFVGDSIESSGSEIPSSTTITAINGSTITLSAALASGLNDGDSLIVNQEKTLLKFTTIVRLINVVGEFGVGETVQGNTTGHQGTIHRVDGNNIYVVMQNDDVEFQGSELLQQVVGGVPSASIQGTITEVINTDTIKVDHRLKVFGVQSTDPSANVDEAFPTPAFTSVKKGTTDTNLDTQNYYYWTAQFRFDNGKIGAASGPSNVIEHNVPSLLDTDRYISLSLARTSGDYGILVYRGSTSNLLEAELISVLGPRELGNINSSIVFNDQGTFTRTEWSTKTTDTNAFSSLTTAPSRLNPNYDSSNIVYFPLVPPTNEELDSERINGKGWVTGTVERVLNKKTVRLDAKHWHNDDYVEIVHDNTDGLQAAINENRDLALRNIVLPDGVYYTSRLDVPSNFALIGNSKRTVLKQIPWNFEFYDDLTEPTLKGTILTPQDQNPERITIRDITVDGNMVNQILWQEDQANYSISIPNGIDVSFDNINVQNSAGAGIYALDNERLRVSSCQVRDGGLSYSEDETQSPLFAASSRFVTITDNIFENWSAGINTSVTRIGTIVSNTIRNCGSGLLIYGSGNLLSSPNLIMGTDDEWIPSVDKLDSDYDSVNIDLDPGVDYVSPSLLYLRDNEPLYLASTDASGTPGSAVELSSDILTLTKVDNVESLSAPGGSFDYTLNSSNNPIIEVGVNGDEGEFGRQNGYFQWRIIATNANQLPTYSELKSQWEASSPPTGESLIGLVYRIKATEYAYVGADDDRIYVDQIEFTESGGEEFAEFELVDDDEQNIFAIGDVIRCFNIQGVTPDINGIEITVTEKNTSAGNTYVKGEIFGSVSIGGTTVFDTSGQTEKPYLGIRNTFVLAKGRIT